MSWVVIKKPEVGDISKSAKFFDTLDEAVAYKDSAPYPSMVVAEVLNERSVLVRVMFWLSRRSVANGKEIPAVC